VCPESANISKRAPAIRSATSTESYGIAAIQADMVVIEFGSTPYLER
jgi:hypothetical protein